MKYYRRKYQTPILIYKVANDGFSIKFKQEDSNDLWQISEDFPSFEFFNKNRDSFELIAESELVLLDNL